LKLSACNYLYSPCNTLLSSSIFPSESFNLCYTLGERGGPSSIHIKQEVKLYITVFWDVTLCSLVQMCQLVRETCCLHCPTLLPWRWDSFPGWKKQRFTHLLLSPLSSAKVKNVQRYTPSVW
jgi:hypothetical protein